MANAQQFRDMADNLQSDIEAAFAPRDIGTHKRLQDAMAQASKGVRLVKCQYAMRKLAGAMDAGEDVPYTTKTAVLIAIDRNSDDLQPYLEGGVFEVPSEVTHRFDRQRILQKKYNDLFPTPEAMLTDDINLHLLSLEKGMRVLEPSAGLGDIASFIIDRYPGVIVDCIEVVPALREYLTKSGFNLVGNDFMEYQTDELYDYVVMNPPFSNDEWAEHVAHAWELLKPGGRLISVIPNNIEKNSKKVALARALYYNTKPFGNGQLLDCTVDFKSGERKTGVSTKILVLDKNAEPVSEEKDVDEIKLAAKSFDIEMVEKPKIDMPNIIALFEEAANVPELSDEVQAYVDAHDITESEVRALGDDVLTDVDALKEKLGDKAENAENAPILDSTKDNVLQESDNDETETDPVSDDELDAPSELPEPVSEPTEAVQPTRRVFQVGPTRIVETSQMRGKSNDDVRGILMSMYPEIKDADIQTQVQTIDDNPVQVVRFKPKAGTRG